MLINSRHVEAESRLDHRGHRGHRGNWRNLGSVFIPSVSSVPSVVEGREFDRPFYWGVLLCATAGLSACGCVMAIFVAFGVQYSGSALIHSGEA